MNENKAPVLPEYVCHKRVKAARIVGIEKLGDELYCMFDLILELPEGGKSDRMVHPVPVEYIERHKPEVGGYFLRFEGGLAGYASEEAFQRDYSRVPNPVQVKNLAELELLLSMRPPLPTPDPSVLTVRLPITTA